MKQVLQEIILANSVSKDFVSALEEFQIIAMEEDPDMLTECLCTQPHLRYLYKIRNTKNGKVLFPIGSSCINAFGNDRLDNELKAIDYGELPFKHGKYEGTLIKDIVRLYPDYVEFLISERTESHKKRTNGDYEKLIEYYQLSKAASALSIKFVDSAPKIAAPFNPTTDIRAYGDLKFNHGKYAGMLIKDIVNKYPSYVTFIVKERKPSPTEQEKNADYKKLSDYFSLVTNNT